MKLVYSFDVFDTCLLRACAFPVDAFYETGLLLAAGHGLEPHEDWAAEFAIARCNAEIRARKESGAEDVPLARIWDVLVGGYPFLDRDSGIDSELGVEKSLLRSNVEMLARVGRVRGEGARIVFISDTCLPQDFLRRMLQRHGFWCEGDALYVSGEVGKTKASGTLYQHVLDDLGVAACDLVHHGDNAHADVKVPRMLGIRAEGYGGSVLLPGQRAMVSGYAGCGMTGRRIAGLQRIFQHQGRQVEGDLRSYVHEFLGPLLIVLASWIVGEARRAGVRRLYFLARDGYLLQRVARAITQDLDGPECRYLYASRQALLLPSVFRADRQELTWLVDDEDGPRLGTLLAKLDLDMSSCGRGLRGLAGPAGADFRLRTRGHWDRFWSGLAEETVVERIRAAAHQRRVMAVAYMRQEGLFDPRRAGVVDLGWLLNVQRALNRILNDEEEGRSVEGFYLALSPDRNWDQMTGGAKALFIKRPRTGNDEVDQSSFFGYANVLEYAVSFAPHGTVHHYEKSGDRMGASYLAKDGASLDACRSVALMVDDYVEEYRRTYQPAVADGEEARNVVRVLLEPFLTRPTKAWSRLFAEASVSSDQNNSNSVPMVHPLSLTEALGVFLKGKRHLGEAGRCRWLEASAAVSGPLPRCLLRTRALVRRVVRGQPTTLL